MAVKRKRLSLIFKTPGSTPFFLNNQRGVAVVEMLPMLVIMVMLFGLTFGFWGAIHSGVLKSIAARHYALEVINNRSNFLYHRDTDDVEDYYGHTGYRFFAIVESQEDTNPEIRADKKELSLFNQGFGNIPGSRSEETVNPIWLKVGYGICTDHACGGL